MSPSDISELSILCPNCGALKSGRFCSVCGQNDRDYDNGFWTIARDAVGELFELDGRVAQSLKTIVLKPGQLSVEFEANRRANFVSPIRLFLFTSIIWFFLFSISIPEPENVAGGRSEVHVDFVDSQETLGSEDVAHGIEEMRSLLDPWRVRKLNDILSTESTTIRKRTIHGLASVVQNQPEWEFLKKQIVTLSVEIIHSPENWVEDVVDNLPLTMFVLLPWYALLLSLFYIGKKKRFVHHFVFAIHVHAFSFLLLSLVILTPARSTNDNFWGTFWSVFDLIVILALMCHIYLSFKRFYDDGHAKTIAKYLLLGWFYLWGLIPALVLVLGYTVTSYL